MGLVPGFPAKQKYHALKKGAASENPANLRGFDAKYQSDLELRQLQTDQGILDNFRARNYFRDKRDIFTTISPKLRLVKAIGSESRQAFRWFFSGNRNSWRSFATIFSSSRDKTVQSNANLPEWQLAATIGIILS